MNTALLLEIKQRILNEPRSFAMSEWKQNKESRSVVEEGFHIDENGVRRRTYHDFPRCGTACCIGGWARAITLEKEPRTPWKLYEDYLELSVGLSSKLFYVTGWDEPFQEQYMRAKTPEERAPIAAAYIDHFILKYNK